MSLPRPVLSLLHLFAAALAGYLILLGVLWWGQSGMVFLPEVPERSVRTTPGAAGLDYEPVRIETADGERLAGWFVPGPTADAPVVLFLHGNAGNIGHRIETLELLHTAGAASLIIDYRGYGDSSGHPTERGTYRDAQAAWRWLVDRRGVAPGRIVVFGRSLGGAVAAWLAAHERPAGLVLEAAFTSIVELGRHHYWWAPVGLLSRFRYPTARYLRDVECPVLVAHARHDEIVPFAHAEKLAAIRPPVVELLELEGGHNDAMFASHRRYRETLQRFIGEVTRTE
ncbi:MAG: alpha/beta fold hydrolase [Halofilum sp. (in: g-proteobacteria)]|nr:alpha/beta fold hydrolase [Halofilum sp. (in: g-proteobacteria)]